MPNAHPLPSEDEEDSHTYDNSNKLVRQDATSDQQEGLGVQSMREQWLVGSVQKKQSQPIVNSSGCNINLNSLKNQVSLDMTFMTLKTV